MKQVAVLGLCVLCLLLGAPQLQAQTQITSGTIQGTVMDPSGAVLPDATVTIKNLDTNVERSLNTSGDGRFVFLQLPPGRYHVSVAKSGFSTAVVESLPLTVGQSVSLNLSMKVSPVAEQVVVTDTPTIDPTKTESSTTLNALSVEQTPVLGRKFEDLFTLTPGVAIVQGPDGDEISFAGQRGIFNNISLDGGDYMNGFFGEQLGGQRPAVDITMEAIREFQVIAAAGSAEFGRTASGVVNVVTKSGTNELHGSLFYFQRLEALTADDSQGNPLEDFHREQFGFTIGGPIVKDRAFFFVAGEQITGNLERPNLSRPLGSAACPVASPTVGADEPLLDENDPLFVQDCQRLALLNFMQTSRGQEEGNPVRHPIHNTSFLGKLDFNFNPANHLNLSYSFNRSRNVNQTFDVSTYGNSANGIEGRAHIHALNVNLFSTISPSLFNEAHFTYSRESRPRSAVDSNVPADTAMPVGVPGLPFFLNPDAFRFGHPFFLNPDVDELFWRTQVRDNFSIVHGKHTIKFGGEWIHSLNDQIFRGFFEGRYIFDSVVGFLRYASPQAAGGFGPSTAACSDGTYATLALAETCASGFTGGPLLLFLQGAGPTGPATDATGASNIKNEEFALFIQDKWQIRPNFTLSFGLRWEAQLMPETVDPTTTAYGIFLNDTTTPTVLGPGFPSDGTLPDQTDMWQPRVGFAWDLFSNSKSVLRAHWGIYNARQNMLTQVGSVTTNGLQQQTIFVNTQLLIDFGVPTPAWPGLVTPAASTCGANPFPCFSGVRVFSRNYENPRVYTGNIAFEQELYPDWVAYVDVTISNGTRLTRFIDVNRADRGSPFSLELGETMVTTSIGQSSYRGATFGIRKRYSHGFQLEMNYVLSKDEDDDSNERDPFVDRSIRPFDLSFDFGNSNRDSRHKFNFYAFFDRIPGGFEAGARAQARSAQPITVDPTVGRNTGRKDNEFFSLDWRVSRPFRFGERYAIIPIFEMFNTFDNDNNINPLIGPGLFNFDGFLRQGVGDPLQVQLAVKFTF
ncbi:MAG: carboxypeptidase regulatory-like domain-containing protein [Candidatus Acidiferrales bacterium]